VRAVPEGNEYAPVEIGRGENVVANAMIPETGAGDGEQQRVLTPNQHALQAVAEGDASVGRRRGE